MKALPIRRHELLFIFGILMLCLWATITNVVPASVGFVVLAPVLPYYLYKNPTLPRSVVACLALFGYFILNTLAYAPESLVDPEFYRRDGNVFVTFMPLLIGGALNININLEKIIRSFVHWVTGVNVVLLALFAATGGTIVMIEPGVYHMLFESHNAAGGFLAMVLCLVLGQYRGVRKTPLLVPVLLVNLIALVATVSRGSMLGLLCAVFLVMVLKERFIRTTIVAMVLGTIVVMSVVYPMWLASSKPVGIYVHDGSVMAPGEMAGDANTADRVLYLWPRAVDDFLQSPLIGTGFGSYNDVPYNFAGIPHVLSFNRPATLVFSSGHAHNTYLHVLAETGLVGLGLLAYLLREMWRDIDSLQSRSVRLGLKLGFWMAVFSSLTEHRMFTPSEMLVYTILLGLALGSRRSTAAVIARPEAGPQRPPVNEASCERSTI